LRQESERTSLSILRHFEIDKSNREREREREREICWSIFSVKYHIEIDIE
jgi:hypothetical protein